jgi:hypothetical protein
MDCEKTCFAAMPTREKGCLALNVAKCGGTDCPFYKTPVQVAASQRKAKERLKRISLGLEPAISLIKR